MSVDDRDRLQDELAGADGILTRVAGERDRLQESKNNWHRSYVLCRQERDRYREALRNGVEIATHYMDTDGRGDLDGWIDAARAALATPDTPPDA